MRHSHECEFTLYVFVKETSRTTRYQLIFHFIYYPIIQSKLIHSKMMLRTGSGIQLKELSQRGKLEF